MTLKDGRFDPARIAEHNARVLAFRAALAPVLAAMTDEQCRAVVAMAKVDGLSMNRIAGRMRGPLGGTWDDEHVGAGIAIYRTALERLGEYDEDFRPYPERLDMGETYIGGKVYYLTESHEFEVVAGGLSERFVATWRPRFGMDVGDQATADEISRRLLARQAP